MKNKKQLALLAGSVLLLLLIGGILFWSLSGNDQRIVVEGDFQDGSVVEYTAEKVQFPVAHVENGAGQIVSYNVEYKIIDLSDNSEQTDEYATFDLKTGDYRLVYTFADDAKVSHTVSFAIRDTVSPVVEFIDVPNGLFLQDITEDTVNKLPLYSIEDASTADGIDLVRTLTFKGEGDGDFKEYAYREINNSYMINGFGTFRYMLTATDAYGNKTDAAVQWKVKDRDWKPAELPADGILADYSVEGYCNLVESGDANQYYKIGNDYSDEWLAEYQGAQGVLKIDLPFNDSVGWGNNTIRLRLPKTFTQQDLEGKYLAVRIYVEGEHLKDNFLFGGNNVEFRPEDSTTRAFTTTVNGLQTGVWKTYYIEAATAQNIGMYPNATYNPDTTFYEGGDPADSIQLCFHREAGYYNDMTLYVDSISIAQVLPDTQITVSGKEAVWTPVEGAVGYLVSLNGEESVVQDTKITLPGDKGYVRVTPLGNGVTTLDAQTVTAVYGLDAGDSLAKFDDKLYIDLFTDQLKFSTDAEHNGYRPQTLRGSLAADGVTMDIGTGAWGVVTGIRFQFPNPQEKGSNTTLVMDMHISNSDYGQIRVYDYAGKPLGNIKLDETNTGDLHTFEIDISAYEGKLEGVQLIFGPNSDFSSVSGGVSVTFKQMRLANTYYPITVNGQSLMCAGTRKLTPHFTTKDLVQFSSVYNFGVPADNTQLKFSGTLLLDGKKMQETAISVVGYPNTDTICFNVPHNGKILTIMKDSVIYYNGTAVQVEETFNAKWNGSSWEAIGSIPPAPATEYVTLKDGSVKTVEEKVALTAGYTANAVVQFTNVYDFGVAADDTPIGFEGTVMLDGQKVYSPVFVGYPENTTIALKVPHQGKLLTITKGSVIYCGDKAVVLSQTFNQKWNGSYWENVAQIPEEPAVQYVTLADGTTRVLVGVVELNPLFTKEHLVQFPDVYDFGATQDSTPLGFQGTVLLQGKQVENPAFTCHKDSTTIALEKLSHQGKVVTVMEGAIIYNDSAAVKVGKTFNAVWDGTNWTEVAQIPEPPAKEYITVAGGQRELVDTVTLTPGYTTDTLVQFTNVYDFGATQDSTPLGFQGTVLLQGKQVENPAFTCHKDSTTIALEKLSHKGKVVTVMEGTIIYNDSVAVKVGKTFNAVWDGTNWTEVAQIPEPPAKEYITVAGGQRELVDTVTLTPGYTTEMLVQFTNVYDFGATQDSTPLGFQGTVLLQGKQVENPTFTCHKDSTTIALEKLSHKGKVVTVMEGAVIYNDSVAVKVGKTFNAVWDGTSWTEVAQIPEPPAKEYITVGGQQKELVATVTLQPGHTQNDLVQFINVYDFGLTAERPLGFAGDVYLDGVKLGDGDYRVDGYPSNTTVALKLVTSKTHTNKVLTVKEGAVLYYGDVAVKVAQTFSMRWDGSTWTAAQMPEPGAPGEPDEPTQTQLSFQYRYGTANLIQVNTNLPASTPCENFLTSDNGSSIDESANQYHNVSWIAMENVEGTIVLTFTFHNKTFEAGQNYTLAAGSIFGFTDGEKYTLDKNYTFTFDGNGWSMEATDPPEEQLPAFGLTYRFGNGRLLQVNTDLPAATPCATFTKADNGCSIDDSAGDQQVNQIMMSKMGDSIILVFSFNTAFEANQTYVLPKGSVFGFSDGSKYALDKDYTFRFNGSAWSVV